MADIALGQTATSKNYTVSSLTFALNNTSGSFLVVCVGLNKSGASVSSITFNGTSLSKLTSIAGTSYSYLICELWYLAVAPQVNANIVITASTTCDYFYGAGVTITNVNSASNQGGGETLTTSHVTRTVTTTIDKSWRVETCMNNGAAGVNPDSGQTNFGSHDNIFAASYEGPITPAGSDTSGFTTNAGNDNWVMLGWVLEPSASAAPKSLAINTRNLAQSQLVGAKI